MTQKQAKKAKEILIRSYEVNWPSVSQACKSAGVLRKQFYRWKESDEKFAEAITEIDETKMDEAEQVLVAESTSEKPNVSALMFLLRSRRRNIYGDKTETEHKGTVTLEPLVIKIDDGKKKSHKK